MLASIEKAFTSAATDDADAALEFVEKG